MKRYFAKAVPDAGPATFAPEEADPWHLFFEAAILSGKAGARVSTEHQTQQPRAADRRRLLNRWMTLADAVRPTNDLQWWEQAMSASGPWVLSDTPWPPDQFLQNPGPGRLRALAAWLRRSPELTPAHPRLPRQEGLRPEKEQAEQWAERLLDGIWKSSLDVERLRQTRPAGDPSTAAFKVHVIQEESAHNLLGAWCEAAASLEERLGALGASPTGRWRQRFHHYARIIATCVDVGPSLSPSLADTWHSSLGESPVFGSVSFSGTEKEGWMGAVEALIRAGVRFVPHWVDRHEEDRIQRWWAAVEQAATARRTLPGVFPSSGSAWDEWRRIRKGVVLTSGSPDANSLDARVSQWCLELAVATATRPAPARRRM